MKTVTEKLQAYNNAVRSFESVRDYLRRKAWDNEGFRLPLTPDAQARIEDAARDVRDALRSLVL